MSDQIVAAIIAAFAAIVVAFLGFRATRHRPAPGHITAVQFPGDHGLRITYPLQGSRVSGEVEVTGTFVTEPPQDSIFLINAGVDGPPYWPCVGRPIEISSANRTWRGSTYINADTRIKLLSIGPSARALFDYYQKVGNERGWLGIDRLTPDAKELDQVLVRLKGE